MTLAPATTKQQFIYQHLKNSILECKLPPGHRVVIDDVAKDLGISMIPVREALQLLQAERLVEIRPHAGATVTEINSQSIKETFLILEGIETMAVRQVAFHFPAGLDLKLEGLIRQMDKAGKTDQLEKWAAINMEFHLAISRAANMAWLSEITERALHNWNRIRRYFSLGGIQNRFTEAQQEHHALLKAFRKGDADLAEKIIRQHNQRAFQHYTTALAHK